MTFMIIITTITLTSSLFFIFLNHPLAAGMALVWQTGLICAISSLTAQSSWFSYILFLIFLGAVLVLFIYIAALASNETFKMSIKMTSTHIIVSIMVIFSSLLIDPINLIYKDTIENSTINHISMMSPVQPILSKMYNMTSATLTMFVILYLLLTLVIVVKLASTTSGPLRKN